MAASTALFLLGRAMGDTHGLLDYVCVGTIMNTLSAVPLSPGGLGVGEVLAGSLLKLAGSSYTIGVAASITYRLCMFFLGLLGGLGLLVPGGTDIGKEFRQAEEQGEGFAAPS
ncbi:MAG: lysylphosphatidylglycerol synthase domain-containing protein [Planctomycetota bacterium]